LGCHFYSTSAKLNKNVSDLFEDVAKQVVGGRKDPGDKKKKGSGCSLL